ncbi:hypothetical protein LCGC14_1921040 [marine sediment metagenome]|uniref:Uncharacterized protein n=1 Tax=marine sediment metagenome TaxID=412755 RepID=A0A0F9FQM8_9ZZZZ
MMTIKKMSELTGLPRETIRENSIVLKKMLENLK